MKLVIRSATQQDIPAVLAINNWAIENTVANFRHTVDALADFEQEWRTYTQTRPWLVADASSSGGASVVGYARASEFKSRCGYSWTSEVSVYVDPAHHGQGIGGALYDRIIPILDTQGFRTLIAVIAQPNPVSNRLHERFGFRRVGVFERIGWKHGGWHDVAYYQRRSPKDNPPTELRPPAEVSAELLGAGQATVDGR